MAKNTKAFVQDFAFYEQLWEYYSKNRGKIRSRYNDLTKKFLAYNDSNENSDAFLREPQFEALEMYVFVKEFMDNAHMYQMFDEWRKRENRFSDASYYTIHKGGQGTLLDMGDEQNEIVFKQMKKYKDSGVDLNGADPETALAPRMNGSVTDDGFNPIYLPSPLNTIADESSGTERGYVKYSHGEIYRNMNKRENSQGIDENFVFLEQSDALYRYAEQLDMNRNDLLQIMLNSDATNDYLLADCYDATKYTNVVKDVVDYKVSELAN